MYTLDGTASIRDVWDSGSGLTGKRLFDWFSQNGV